MTFPNTNLVHVYYQPDNINHLVGRLGLKNQKIFFEYNQDFINTGLELSPFKLPLKPGIVTNTNFIFDGLFGLFNDSLPDGWGRLLMDRKLINLGINPGALSPLDRLCFVGRHGMGALLYEPDKGPQKESKKSINEIDNDIDLDKIADEIKTFQLDDCSFIEDLLILGGSSAGARPKALVSINEEDWIVKFRSSVDPKDISSIEYAYHLMAIAGKVRIPEAKLFPSRQGNGFFGVKRFDRCNGRSIHMQTISGLLHADHRLPCLDYGTIMKATAYLTRDIGECETQFRYAVFNVLSHNRDDHSKNFSFLMDQQGIWRVSPAYDLTFSSGPSGEHCTMVMGEGKNPTTEHLLKLATIGEIKREKALQIIDDVKQAVKKWPQFADEAKVSQASKQMISKYIQLH